MFRSIVSLNLAELWWGSLYRNTPPPVVVEYLDLQFVLAVVTAKLMWLVAPYGLWRCNVPNLFVDYGDV